MVYIPPVNIPDLSQRQSYASQIYSGLSGVGDAFRQNRVDKWNKEENDRQYARAIANDQFNQMDANRRFGLEQERAAQATSDQYFQPQWAFNQETQQWGLVQPSKAGGPAALVDMPNGWDPMPTTTWRDFGTYQAPFTTRGSLPAGPPMANQGSPEPGTFGPGVPPYGDGAQGGGQGGPAGGAYGPKAVRDEQQFQREFTQAQTKGRAAVNMVESNAETLNGALDQMDQIMQSGWATGFKGWLGRNTTGAIGVETEGGQFAALADQIKSRIVQDTLQRVRELSPTGGAFGQVSDFENRLMAATQGPIDPNNPTLTAQTLQNIRRTYAEYVAANRLAYMVDFEGLDPQTFSNALDAIRQGADPQAVVARAMGRR